MKKKDLKILIVTHWFYPKQIPRAFRAYELYTKLLQKYHVDILIGDYKEKIIDGEKYEDRIRKYVQAKESRITFLTNLEVIQLLKKGIEYFIGERYLVTRGKFLIKNIDLHKYDVVISVGLPFYIHWIVANKIKNYKKNGGEIRSISDWGDPFVGQTTKKIASYFKNIQKKVCETFDYIVIPTEKVKEYYSNYTFKEKIKVIPQGVDFSRFKIEKYKKNKIPHFIYTGIFYEKIRDPENFFKFLAEIKEEFLFTIYTVKHGTIYNKIIKKYEQILGEKIRVYEIIPREECIKKLSENDFLINIENETTTQIPSKLIDYAISGRPILSFSSKNIPKEKFLQFLKGNYNGAKRIKIEEYDIDNVIHKFEEIIEDENR